MAKSRVLIALAAALASLALSWIRHGGKPAESRERLKSGLWHGSGLLALVLAGTLAERPPDTFFDAEYDRISVVHVALAGLVVCYWAANLWLSRRDNASDDALMRWVTALSTGIIVLAIMYQIYTKFFLGPTADMDPVVAKVFLNQVAELRPFLVWHSPSDFWVNRALYFVFAAIALPFLAVTLIRDQSDTAWDAWMLLAITLTVFIFIGVVFSRFLPYAGIVLSIAAAGAVVRLLDAVARRNRRLSLGCTTLILLAIVGQSAISVKVVNASLDTLGSCQTGLRELARHLNDLRPGGAETEIILAQPAMGPELLYRTGHGVVATPSQRNPGILAYSKILGATDDTEARRELAARKVTLIVLCRAMRVDPRTPRLALYLRLLEGKNPSWLRRMRLPMHIGIDFRAYRVTY